MCDIITMVLPMGADRTAVNAVLEKHGRQLMELTNPHMAGLLKPGEIYIQPYGNGCDCGTALGSLNSNRQGLRPVCEPDAGLRGKGWSESKIQRWLAQKSAAEDRNALRWNRRRFPEDFGPDGWCDILRDLLRVRTLSYAGVFLHRYNGALETEVIEVKGRNSLPRDDNFSNALLQMEDDTLYIGRENRFHGRPS